MWAQVVLLGKIFAKPLEVEHVDVEVVDESAENVKVYLKFSHFHIVNI